MDPTATLREISEIHLLGRPLCPSEFDRLVELVDALTEWLHKGGYAPLRTTEELRETWSDYFGSPVGIYISPYTGVFTPSWPS